MSNEIEFSPGSILAGRFRLISELGAGGMGVAYRAWDQRADIPVVIKMPRRELLAKDPQFAKRFDREIRMMASLTHPNIVPIVDFGEDSGLPYVAMRFLPGGSLSNRRLRDREGKVTPNHPSTLHLWLPGIASALDMVHSASIVHRDVKPGNIFFDGFWTAFLGDFGIAKLLQDPESGLKEETLTGTNVGIGTPEYMSPEQFSPKAVLDGRSDQYALGIMVYEMLSGTRPFRGDTNHFAVEHLTMPPPLLSSRCAGLPKSLCNAVHRSLSKKPDERFKSCGEFATAVLSDVPRRDLESDVVRLLCPSCGNILKLPFTAGSKKGKCPKCQTAMNVAKDLGALWLESEAVSLLSKSQKPFRVTEKPLSTLTPASKTTPVFTDGTGGIDGIGGQTTPLLDPTVLRFGIVAALVAFVVIIALVLSHFSSKNSDVQTAALPQAQIAVNKTATNPTDKPKFAAGTDSEISKPEPVVFKSVEIVTNSIGMELIGIPAGKFTMGDDAGVAVTLTKSFELGKYEVTQGEWKEVMGTEPWKGLAGVQADKDCPTTWVSWDDATEFCKKLTEIDRKAGKLQAGKEYRLPTEAEWEYACCAGTTTAFSFGNDPKQLGEYGWFDDNAKNAGQVFAHTVGLKKPNLWGFHDMHGNVFEWCSDWYGTLPGGTDPVGPEKGEARVYRGGSWWRSPGLCRSAVRDDDYYYGFYPAVRLFDLGFRVARSQSETVTRPVMEKPKPVEEDFKSGESVINSIGMELIGIPAGTFTMGDGAMMGDGAGVAVTLTQSFGLGKYEVTQGQWKEVMGTEPWKGLAEVQADKDFPATFVYWDDAKEFCEKLTATEHKNGKLPEAESYRLPTEAEWEYACRAGTTTAYSFGDDVSQLGEHAWFNGKAFKVAEQYAHKVGKKKPNPWGLHDMHGNVWEWCSDWYGIKLSGGVDPNGPNGGLYRVYRGGCFGGHPVNCRSAYRHFPGPSYGGYLGFRVARSQSAQ